MTDFKIESPTPPPAIPRTCGNCLYYAPAVNPNTKRKLPSQPGRCAWPVPRPEKWPMAYMSCGYPPPRPYQQQTIWDNSNAEKCETWVKK